MSCKVTAHRKDFFAKQVLDGQGSLYALDILPAVIRNFKYKIHVIRKNPFVRIPRCHGFVCHFDFDVLLLFHLLHIC